jgi:hypothetical protein
LGKLLHGGDRDHILLKSRRGLRRSNKIAP